MNQIEVCAPLPVARAFRGAGRRFATWFKFSRRQIHPCLQDTIRYQQHTGSGLANLSNLKHKNVPRDALFAIVCCNCLRSCSSLVCPVMTSQKLFKERENKSVGTMQEMLTCSEEIVPGCIPILFIGSHSTGKDLYICTFWCMCLQDGLEVVKKIYVAPVGSGKILFIFSCLSHGKTGHNFHENFHEVNVRISILPFDSTC